MTDRELLELAAKAAGVKVFSYIDNPMWGTGINTGEVDEELWNPLANDSDALRLAVKLEMTILADPGIDGCVAAQIDPPTSPLTSVWADELAEPDHHAATRRAIVRAAAEIGKEMK